METQLEQTRHNEREEAKLNIRDQTRKTQNEGEIAENTGTR